MNLNALNMFVKVVQHEGFSKASRKSGTAVATLSRNVKELEETLGIRLLERSTRRLRTTREGELLFEYASKGLEEIKTGQLALTDLSVGLQGTLRISIPPTLDFWWPVLIEFQKAYPNIKLDIFTSDRRIDFISDGIDVAMRIGDLETQTAIARKLSDLHHFVVASPDFLDEKGQPETPDQLQSFACAVWRGSEMKTSWNLGGKDYAIQPTVKVNDYSHLLALALAGQVITELPPLLAKPYLLSGELIQLFSDQQLPTLTLNLLYPSRKYLPPITRAYIDFPNYHLC